MGKTILIVDDDPAQRRLLQAAVERNGFLTRAAENGAQAVEAVEKHADIDIVLLDLVMPGMTGQEALKEIRMRRGDLPCIVLTASGGIDTVVQAMQAGASDFFVKPASPDLVRRRRPSATSLVATLPCTSSTPSRLMASALPLSEAPWNRRTASWYR